MKVPGTQPGTPNSDFSLRFGPEVELVGYESQIMVHFINIYAKSIYFF